MGDNKVIFDVPDMSESQERDGVSIVDVAGDDVAGVDEVWADDSSVDEAGLDILDIRE